MKKTLLTTLALTFLMSSLAYSQNDEAHSAYLQAMGAPTLAQKIQLLKNYINKYKGQGTQYEHYAYANLCILSSQTGNLNDSIDYGENALLLGGLDDYTKTQVLFVLSTIYTKQGKNLEKAKNYALQVVELSRVNKSKKSATTNADQWDKLIGAGYYTHAQAQEKAKQLKGAASSYIKSYDILKNPQIGKDLKKVGKALYKFKFYKDAEEAFRVAYKILGDYESGSFYAKTLFRNNKKNEALTNFKKVYSKQKSGEVAFYIGIILAENGKKDESVSQEAIQYLLEASFLSPSNSEQARALAESLFFHSKEAGNYNQKVKELTELSKQLEEMTELFNENFGEKNEDELSDKEKKEIKSWLKDIEALEAKIKKIETEQNVIVQKFNRLLEETKNRLEKR
ncbi:MAG: hypothetical protein GTO17_10415 [Candidatus Aminicenantes bacterium]|nr:hypothetical protein [Candidatus Aminicenantes bacterium]